MLLTTDEAGRCHLHIAADLAGEGAGVARFHALLRAEAAKLAALGDTSPLEDRMVRALEVLADRQAALDLSAGSQVTARSATRSKRSHSVVTVTPRS